MRGEHALKTSSNDASWKCGVDCDRLIESKGHDTRMIDWKRFCELVRSNERFILTSHIRPDCDALGSELGMAGVLEKLGKQVTIVNAQATPPNLEFIDPQRKIKTLGCDVQPADIEAAQVLMVLDTSAWAQLGEMAEVVRATRLHKAVLDHHVDTDDMGAELFKNTEAEATGRLVVEAAAALGVKLTAEMARPLFAALATDTGWFRFLSTTGNTYRIAGEWSYGHQAAGHLFGAVRAGDTGPAAAAGQDSGTHADRSRRAAGLYGGGSCGF